MTNPFAKKLLLISLGCLFSVGALCESIPTGNFQLEKGTLGCPSELQMQENERCGGFELNDVGQKNQTRFCNVNGGKYLRRWKEEGFSFFAESKSIQQESFLQMKELVTAKKDQKVIRQSRTDITA